MYRAKDAGRSRAVAYDPVMGEVVRRRVELDRALRQALGRDELRLDFQPIVELATGRLLGFEALARWEPRIEVRTVWFDVSQAGSGLLTIDIGYQVRATNTSRNLVYPFYVIPAEEME